jgi:hypothetical protein
VIEGDGHDKVPPSHEDYSRRAWLLSLLHHDAYS